ncbi:MAG: hypothetical protein J5789_00545 [Oscillospiraceae bacterium]|nr:hypothetical protein [Oscillospiraceae bacterium]
MRRFSSVRLWLPLTGIGLFLLFPGPAGEGARAGLRLCGTVLIPALFPVSVLAGCLVRTGTAQRTRRRASRWMRALFGLPETCALPLLLGLLGGFPLGAHLTAAAREEGWIGRQEAARLAGLCNNAGPAFLLGAVSSLLGSPALGIQLWAIQLLSALLAGLFLRQTPAAAAGGTAQAVSQPSPGAVLPKCIESSALAMLRLTGAVVFFQAALACLAAVLPVSALPAVWQAGFYGILELTGGLSALQAARPEAVLPLGAALLGWGGLCVHLQAAEALARADIPLGPYFRHKALQAGISLLLAAFLVLGKNFIGNQRFL